jgi:hypothetical protein
MVHKRHRTVKHRKRCSKTYKKLVLKGIIKGGDASTYATAVYGAPEQQHAVSESNNVIAMNTVHSVQTGGDAVPAVDVTSLSPASLEAITTMKLAPEPVPMQGGAADPVPHVAQGGVAHTATHAAAAHAAPVVHAAAHQAGGKRARQSGGLLTDLAVPAVLLVANQAMTKRHRKSGKKSHKYRKGGAHKK